MEIRIDAPIDRINGQLDKPELEAMEWRDFLDVFSAVWNYLIESYNEAQYQSDQREIGKRLTEYRATLKRIFAEQNALLVFGKDGIIHPKIDQAFEQQRASLIAGLARSDYEAALGHIRNAEAAMLLDPQDGANAIGSVFKAAENVFKQFSGVKATRLGSREVKKYLLPSIQSAYPSGSNELLLAQRQLNGFCEWVDGAHFYRHEEGKPTPSQPPHELMVLAVSEGYSFVRWLVELKTKLEE